MMAQFINISEDKMNKALDNLEKALERLGGGGIEEGWGNLKSLDKIIHDTHMDETQPKITTKLFVDKLLETSDRA